jgi:hypothetical protein
MGGLKLPQKVKWREREIGQLHVHSSKLRAIRIYFAETECLCFQATTANLVDFLEGCMEAIQLNAVQRGGTYSQRERSLLQALSRKRQQLTDPGYESTLSSAGSCAAPSESSISVMSTVSSSCPSTATTVSYPQFAEAAIYDQ